MNAICEVQPDPRAFNRGERWFVMVLDGHVFDKNTGDPKLKEVQFFTTWSPRNNKKMLLEPNGEKVPLSISSILGIGSEKEMFKGDAKKGYVPSGTA